MEWDIEPGQTVRRKDVHAKYKGQEQGGISTPTTNPNVFIFSDPNKGKSFGYDIYEGQQPDGSFRYTGQGRTGHMQFTAANKALRDAPNDGKAIRLFMADPPWATYVGAYTLGDPGWTVEQIPDELGTLRDGIVFNLIPIDADPEMIPAPVAPDSTSQTDWVPRDSKPYKVAKQVTEQLANREEFQLETRFGEWLQARGDDVQALTMIVGRRTLMPDLYNATTNELIEAKKSAKSEDVRMAIGQVLDYQYCAAKQGIMASPALLLPRVPHADLIGLCKAQGISVYVPSGKSFKDCTP